MKEFEVKYATGEKETIKAVSRQQALKIVGKHAKEKKTIAVRFTALSFLVFLLLCSFQSPEPEPQKLTLTLLVAIVVGLYELFSRLIPSYKNWSLIGKIIDIIKFISDKLNKKKKK